MRQLVRFVEQLSSSGDFAQVKEVDAIIDAIIKTLLIPKGTYVADPEVGSNLYKILFDINDEITLENIRAEIEYAINQVSGADLEKVEFEITPDRKGIIAKIYVVLLQRITKIVSVIITQEYVELLNIQEMYGE